MRRIRPAALLAALGAALTAAPAVALPRPGPGDAAARLVACHTASMPLARSLTVEGTMHLLGGDERMQMRFVVYRRAAPGLAFVRISAPGLGLYNRAAPGISVYRFRKTIQNLAAGDYRVAVVFRWLGPGGGVVAHTTRSAGPCHQPELRPDLQVSGLSIVRSSQAGTAAYDVTVRNRGPSAAAAVELVVAFAGQRQGSAWLGPLGPHAQRTVTVVAPRCSPGAPVTATADPDNRLSEASEANDSLTVSCPAAEERLARLVRR